MDQKYPGFCKMCFLKVTGKGKIKWHVSEKSKSETVKNLR